VPSDASAPEASAATEQDSSAARQAETPAEKQADASAVRQAETPAEKQADAGAARQAEIRAWNEAEKSSAGQAETRAAGGPESSAVSEPETSAASEGERSASTSAQSSGGAMESSAAHRVEPTDAGHASVLLEAVLDWLQPRGNVGFRAVDATLGSGGHSFGLLERSSPDGQLVGLDADAAAIERTRLRLQPFAGRFTLIQRNFRHLDELELEPVDAIVFDLGLSSVQLDASGRGFSFRYEESLDMRFDSDSGGPTAADLLNGLPEAELERIFRDYGEERKSRRLAHMIARRRNNTAYHHTQELVETVIQALGPQRGRIHPATRAFQALRIAVNDELSALEKGLDAAVRLLRPGGRIAVISFHSLEDRIVKWRFRGWADDGLLQVLTRRPQQPDEEEVERNPRARSAKLRVAERVAA